jgi:hypothetical protein
MRTALPLLLLLTACGANPNTFDDTDSGASPSPTSPAGGDSGAPPKQSKDGGVGPSNDGGGTVDASPPPQTPSLQMVSGDGTVVSMGWPAGDPLRVRALNGPNSPAANETVTFALTKNQSLHLQAVNGQVTTDSDGIATLTFNAFGIQPWLGWENDTVTATWKGMSVDFDVIITNVPQGNYPAAPLVQYTVPDGTHDLGTAKAGSVIKGGIVAFAVLQQGPSVGQVLPGWGFRLTDTGDTLLPSAVACVGGTVIADSKGTITCDVQVPSKPGTYYFNLFAAGQTKWSDGHLVVN